MLQIYTSGTSGRPKGVLLTDRNLAAKVTGVIERWGLDEESTSLLATPLFHVGALSWGLVGLASGATTILADDARPATIARHLEDERVTHAFLVPSMLAALAREVGRATAFPALHTVVYGGSPISDGERRVATTVLGPVLRQVYGMTETTGGFTELETRPVPTGRRPSERVGRPRIPLGGRRDPRPGHRLAGADRRGRRGVDPFGAELRRATTASPLAHRRSCSTTAGCGRATWATSTARATSTSPTA